MNVKMWRSDIELQQIWLDQLEPTSVLSRDICTSVRCEQESFRCDVQLAMVHDHIIYSADVGSLWNLRNLIMFLLLLIEYGS